MSWRTDLAANLPDDGEPNRAGPPGSSDLRADILDELEDHLQCATDRELIGTTDSDVARRRVLDRFGSPARVARRLWLDAMKEQIMNQRLAVGINLLVGTLVVVMATVTIVTARNGQVFQAEVLERMEAIAARVTSGEGSDAAASVAADPMKWGRLDVRVVDELDRPVAGANVDLSGSMYLPERRSSVSIVTTDDGRAAFPPMLPGNYILRTTLPGGMSRSNSVVITLGDPTVSEIRAPAMREPDPQPVRFRLALPAQLDGVAGFAAVELGLHGADAATRGWSATPIRLAIRHDGKVARLPSSSPLLDLEATLVGVTIDDLVWGDTIDIDRGSRIGSVDGSTLWLAVDMTRPRLVLRAHSPRAQPPIRLDEMPNDAQDLVSLRVSDVVLTRLNALEHVQVTTSDTRTARVVVPSLKWVDPNL